MALNEAGYRTIAPDLPGLGRSEAPTDVAKYNMQTSVAPAMVALLDVLSLQKVTVVVHDFGAGAGWGLAFIAPDRVERLMVLSVGFPGELDLLVTDLQEEVQQLRGSQGVCVLSQHVLCINNVGAWTACKYLQSD